MSQSQTALVGSVPGPNAINFSCPYNSYIYTINGRSGNYVDQIGPVVCTDGTVSPAWGGGGGSPFHTTTSPTGFAGSDSSGGNYVNQLKFRDPAGNYVSGVVQGSVPGPNSVAQNCPIGQVFTGLSGNSGDYLNQVKWTCGSPTAFQFNCCKGLGDAATCGPYWSTDPSHTCDAVMATYCATPAGLADPVCACFNSEIPSAYCFDQRCTNTDAYKTQIMVNNVGKCPAYINCTQYLGLSPDAKQNIVNNVSQSQQCTSTGASSGGVPPTTQVTNTSGIPPASTAPTSVSPIYMVLGLILLVVVAAFLFMGGDDQSERPVSPYEYPYPSMGYPQY